MATLFLCWLSAAPRCRDSRNALVSSGKLLRNRPCVGGQSPQEWSSGDQGSTGGKRLL
ncbi:hypothetical protein [Larkinella ripae]